MTYNKDTLTIRWSNGKVVDVDHKQVDDISWYSYSVFDPECESEQQYNDNIDCLSWRTMALKDTDDIHHVYSDMDPEEPATRCFIVVHGMVGREYDYTILSADTDPSGQEFLNAIKAFDQGELVDLVEVTLEDNLL